jgi:uncharacterized RDD family membrane protein YckC
MPVTSTDAIYPRLIRRVRAILIDSVILICILLFWWLTLPLTVDFHPVLKIAPLFLLMFILEPLMVAYTGGTPGHHIMGIRVQNMKTGAYVGVVRAFIRALLRGLLGWLSFVIVLTSKKHQAIHDLITQTVVVLKAPDVLPNAEKFAERGLANDGYSYPARWKRILMIVLYNIGGLILISVLNAVALSNDCLEWGSCTRLDSILSIFTSLIWFLYIGASIVMCWKGRLPGCRRLPVLGLAE